MKICAKCHRKYKDSANFCAFCGERLSMLEGEKKPEPAVAPIPTAITLAYTLDGTAQEVRCTEFPAICGRDASFCNLPVPHSSVSRQHCQLVLDGSLLMIEDLGSTNGTSLNGENVTGQMPVEDGDRIGLGKFEVTIAIDYTDK